MNYISTGIYIIQLVLYYLISDGHAQGNVKNIIVKVLRTNCTVNGGNICRNKYLQICYSSTKKQICGRTMPSDCLFPTGGFDTSSTELTAEVGSNSSYNSFTPITTFTYIVVGITPTTSTKRNPLATSCEESRNTTKNGFRVQTRSTDGYQFEILIENICTNPTFCGPLCDTCDPTTTLSSKMGTTSDIRSAINTSTTTFTTPRLRSTVLSDGTTTGYKTVQASSGVTDSSSPKVTSEDTSTVVNNGTNNSTSNLYKSENSSNQNRLLTIIIALVSCIVVILIVVITIYKCYRKHNRMSRTTPAEDDKNCLVENDNTTGGDAYSSTGHSNSLQNHNENLQRENASNEGMPHTTTETINETLNNTGSDGNESMSANQNETSDITSVSQEQEDNESSSITATSEDIEHGNTGRETVHRTEEPSTHRHRKKKKKKKKNMYEERSAAHVPTPSISAGEGIRNVPVEEQPVNANGQNNCYVPDDEISDAVPSNASVEVSGIDVPTSVTDNGGVPHQEQMNDDFHNQAQSNGDVPCQAQSNGDVPCQAQSNGDVPYQAQSNGDVSHQAQSNGDVPCQAQSNGDVLCQAQSNGDVPHQAQSNGDNVGISREDTENNTQANMETFIHNKISEIGRDITEDTNKSINQMKEEFTENMRQQSKEIEQIRKRRKKRKNKMKNLIKEGERRLKMLEDENMKYQKQLDIRLKANSDKQSDDRRKISNSRYVSASRPSGSMVPPRMLPTSTRKGKKKTMTSRLHIKRNGSVQIRRKNKNNLLCRNMGSIDILNSEHGVGFTSDGLIIACRP